MDQPPGLYLLPDAARYAQLDPRMARRWAGGHRYQRAAVDVRGAREAPGVGLTLPPVDGEFYVTFGDLLTLRLVRAFLDAGLGLPLIRRIAEVAAREFGTATPFAGRRFRTEGWRAVRGFARRERVLASPRAFADVVEPGLFANVEWADDVPCRWWPLGRGKAVVLDPETAFGEPRIDGSRVTTAVLGDAVRAEGGRDAAIRAVSRWYGVSVAQVRDAVEFEAALQRRAAAEWLARSATGALAI
jgi:uncharacterized protein (DUF433 family)